MSAFGKVVNILVFLLVSLVFLPLVGIVHFFYAPWEKWFEKIAKF
jgi:hypothetical protein